MELPFVGRMQRLEQSAEAYLEVVSEGGMAFEAAIASYLSERVAERFLDKLDQIVAEEQRGDQLLRSILTEIYQHTLIPDTRGDVMQLLLSIDEILNKYEELVRRFECERPDFPAELDPPLRELARQSVASVEELVSSMRGYFRDPAHLQAHVHKIGYWEREVDKTVGGLRHAIFEIDLDLAHKVHLVGFVDGMAWLSDSAEDVGNLLHILGLKRAL